ncbi:GNAT family N-acetyltransferase [Alkaliphilus serpentinus]|uniref:GNAT family N-acetyltransferase n=1 Tax=Alkaliphilus serpentinus TaxID=1482731 RepID=UPI00186574C6|nr:GNAT family N-acetyltransferase [Alkaliphilus serpentinus]
MRLFIERTNPKDAEKLWKIQRRAFLDDFKKYQDPMNPYNETLERLKEKIHDFIYYTIYIDELIIGGADIRKKSQTHYRLNRIYIDPTYQNKGYGFNAIKFIEESLPNASIWDLDTPHLSFSNQHLYEKLGYKKVGEHKISEKLTLIDYMKKI